MMVVVPFFKGDVHRVVENLKWCIELDKRVLFECLLSIESGADASEVLVLTEQYFSRVNQFAYAGWEGEKRWPIPQNYAFQTTARYVSEAFKTQWLWWESDAIPLKAGWLREIDNEYHRSGRPFMGSVNYSVNYMHGVAVYPHNCEDYSIALLLAHKAPFDVVAGKDIASHRHDASHLFQHVWEWTPGEAPSFFNASSLSFIKKSAVLFHRNKDGTLIKRLMECGGISGIVASVSERLRSWSEPKFVHVVERHRSNNCDNNSRIRHAFDSWIGLYQTGQVRPCHVWDYPRNSSQLGDNRDLPYLKDVLRRGLDMAKPGGIVLLTNDDTVLHPKVLGLVSDALKKVSAVCSFRLNVRPGQLPVMFNGESSKCGKSDLGRDLFAFRKEWLETHWHEIPDFLLGEMEWDLILAMMLREEHKVISTRESLLVPLPPSEIPLGYVFHELHERLWNKMHYNNPAKEWNRHLSKTWCDARGQEYPIVVSK